MNDLHALAMNLNDVLNRVERTGQLIEVSGTIFLTVVAQHLARTQDEFGSREVNERVGWCIGSALANGWPTQTPLSYQGMAEAIESMYGCNWKSDPECFEDLFGDRHRLIEANPQIRSLLDLVLGTEAE